MTEEITIWDFIGHEVIYVDSYNDENLLAKLEAVEDVGIILSGNDKKTKAMFMPWHRVKGLILQK